MKTAAAVALFAAALTLERSIPLPQVSGRIDHLACDVRGQRLFVAALGNNTLEAADLRAGKRLRSAGGLNEPQGVLYVPESNRIIVANGGDGACRIFDADSFRLVRTVKFSGDADNLRYDEARKEVWVGYGDGALGAFDPETGRRLAGVPLGAHPESFQLEKNGPRIFVNVPNAGHIAVVDRVKRAVVAKWPVTAAAANFPMALDEAGHELFIGCRKPPRLLVFGTNSGTQMREATIDGDTDDLFWDAAHKRIYVICGAGVVDVLEPPDYRVVERIKTAPGARTGLFVPDLGRLFVALRGAEIQVYTTH